MALPEWSDARSAAIFLKPCTAKHLNEELGHNLTRQSNNRPGTLTARGGGWLYHRHDLERVRAIMDALGCKPARAVWMLFGIRTLGARKMLPYLELTLDEERDEARRIFGLTANNAARVAPRRRFQ